MKSNFHCQVIVGCSLGRLDMGEGGRRIVGIVHCLEMYDSNFTGSSYGVIERKAPVRTTILSVIASDRIDADQ